MSATARYAVFGHPVSHSLSPQIHTAFARQFGITLNYIAIDAHPERFQDMLALFADSGGRGANVTLPLKQIAHTLATSLSPRAERTGAVNTFIRKGNGWHGDNTDGTGLIRDLSERHGLKLRGRRTLLLGAGGAARGIAPALLEAGIARLSIVNRTTTRSETLAEALGEPERVHPHSADRWAELSECDLIINATSAARDDIRSFPLPSLPQTLITPHCVAVDLNYGKAAIPFIRWAQANNIPAVLDGLGMLVEQAAESFQLWHGQRPDTHPVYTHLRQQTAILLSTGRIQVKQ